MADMRDYRKQWISLQESWKTQDTEVNLSSSKKEILEEGKKKELPDFIKKKIADAKAKKNGTKPGKTPEKAKKCCEEGDEECKEGDKCEVEEGRKHNKGKKVNEISNFKKRELSYELRHEDQPARRASSGSGSKRQNIYKKLIDKGMTPEKANAWLDAKGIHEDAGAGGAVSSAGGATTSAGPVAAPVNNTTPNIARFSDRLGCKPGKKCNTTVKPQVRERPEHVVTGKLATHAESAGKRMFSHFRKFLEAEGFPLAQEAPAHPVGEIVCPNCNGTCFEPDEGTDMNPEITCRTCDGEGTMTEDAVGDNVETIGDAGAEGAMGAPEGMEDMGGEEGTEAPMADILADLQAKFPGAKVKVTVEAGELPFDAETLAKAEEAAASVPEEDELGDIGGDEDLGAAETADVDMGAELAPPEGGLGESIAMSEEGDEANLEAGAEGEGEESPEAAFGGEEGTGDVSGGEGGDLEAGAEEPEISSTAITLSPEQWEAFLAGTETEPEMEPEMEPEAGIDVNQEGGSDQDQHKSTDTDGIE